MKWVWAAVFFVVVVFGGFMTPWQALQHLLQSRGAVGEEDASLIGFVAGYTLPLTAGVAVAAYLLLRGAFESWQGPYVALAVAGILAAAGLIAAYLGLGLLPDYEYRLPSGPPYVSIPLWVLQGYFNTYGWSLMICAAAIGLATALHVDAWLRSRP
jgi:hypothetical protein